MTWSPQQDEIAMETPGWFSFTPQAFITFPFNSVFANLTLAITSSFCKQAYIPLQLSGPEPRSLLMFSMISISRTWSARLLQGITTPS